MEQRQISYLRWKSNPGFSIFQPVYWSLYRMKLSEKYFKVIWDYPTQN